MNELNELLPFLPAALTAAALLRMAGGDQQDITSTRSSVEIDTGGFLLFQPFGAMGRPSAPATMEGTPKCENTSRQGHPSAPVCPEVGSGNQPAEWRHVGFAHCSGNPGGPFLTYLWLAVGATSMTPFRRVGSDTSRPETLFDGPIHYELVPGSKRSSVEDFIGYVCKYYGFELSSNSNAEFELWELNEKELE